MLDSLKSFLNPDPNLDLLRPDQKKELSLPTLWLLGKTGAGKSSLVQGLTGESDVVIGNGFTPCTKTAFAWDFPQEKPLLRFLDTRGLGEAHYDPADDLQLCQAQSHALLIVAKVDDSEQSAVLAALKELRKKIKHVLLIHTEINSLDSAEAQRNQAYNQQQFEVAWGAELPAVAIDFDCDNRIFLHRKQLLEQIAVMLPIIGLALEKQEHASLEEQNFALLRSDVLWHAGIASATDLFPAVGLVSVPAIQGKMLHSLAKQYAAQWDYQALRDFTGMLGASFGVQYGVRLGARQLVKLIPVYGQTAGAVTAAAMSFATTYALGRAAAYYFYQNSKGERVDSEEMQRLYKVVFKRGEQAMRND